MKKKFTVEKIDNLWKVDYYTISKYKYEEEEWLFQSLEDLSIFMEDYFDSLEKEENELLCYNNDSSIN